MARMGRPPKPPPPLATEYDEPLAARVCAHVATGKSLAVACARAGDDVRPQVKLTEDVIFLWLFRSEAFMTAYREAKKAAMMKFLEDTVSIADDESGDTYTDFTKDGDKIQKPNNAKVNRDKLKVAARQWAMQNMNREIFGEVKRGGGAGDEDGVVEIRITGGLPDA